MMIFKVGCMIYIYYEMFDLKKKISSDMFLGFMFIIFGLYVINIFIFIIIKG